MSRGPGKLQRRLLAELEHGASTLIALCERISRKDESVPQVRNMQTACSTYSAARRAIRRLIRRGLVVERLPRARVYRTGCAPTTQNTYVLQTSAEVTNATLTSEAERTAELRTEESCDYDELAYRADGRD